MADQLLEEFERSIDELTFIPSGGGRFEVVLGDTLVYSKAETGQHPQYEEVAVPIRAILG
jgi:selenoprotein W-related protein